MLDLEKKKNIIHKYSYNSKLNPIVSKREKTKSLHFKAKSKRIQQNIQNTISIPPHNQNSPLSNNYIKIVNELSRNSKHNFSRHKIAMKKELLTDFGKSLMENNTDDLFGRTEISKEKIFINKELKALPSKLKQKSIKLHKRHYTQNILSLTEKSPSIQKKNTFSIRESQNNIPLNTSLINLRESRKSLNSQKKESQLELSKNENPSLIQEKISEFFQPYQYPNIINGRSHSPKPTERKPHNYSILALHPTNKTELFLNSSLENDYSDTSDFKKKVRFLPEIKINQEFPKNEASIIENKNEFESYERNRSRSVHRHYKKNKKTVSHKDSSKTINNANIFTKPVDWNNILKEKSDQNDNILSTSLIGINKNSEDENKIKYVKPQNKIRSESDDGSNFTSLNVNSKFQQFSSLARFAQPKHLVWTQHRNIDSINYHPLRPPKLGFLKKKLAPEKERKKSDNGNHSISPKNEEEQPVVYYVQKNIEELDSLRNDNKKKKFKEIQAINKMRMKKAQENAKMRFEQVLDTKLEKIQEKDNRRAFRKMREEGSQDEDWTNLAAIGFLLNMSAEKFVLHKQTVEKCKILSKVLTFGNWFVGRLIRIVQRNRIKKAFRTLSLFMKIKGKVWLNKRKNYHKSVINNFIGNASLTHPLLDVLNMVIWKIRLIQKWYRRIYLQKLIMLSIVNYQWSVIEADIYKDRSKLDHLDINKVHNRIIYQAKKGLTSQIVPVNVRKFYFHEYQKVQKDIYFQQLKKYKEKCKQREIEFNDKLRERNMELVLKGLPIIQEKCPHPSPPHCSVYIPVPIVIEMVKKALVNRLDWENTSLWKIRSDYHFKEEIEY